MSNELHSDAAEFRRAFISAWVNGTCRVLITSPEFDFSPLLRDREAFISDPSSLVGNLWVRAILPDSRPSCEAVAEITGATEVVEAPKGGEGPGGYCARLYGAGPRVRIARLPDLRDPESLREVFGEDSPRGGETPNIYIPWVADRLNRFARDPGRPGTLFIATVPDEGWRSAFGARLEELYRELPILLR